MPPDTLMCAPQLEPGVAAVDPMLADQWRRSDRTVFDGRLAHCFPSELRYAEMLNPDALGHFGTFRTGGTAVWIDRRLITGRHPDLPPDLHPDVINRIVTDVLIHEQVHALAHHLHNDVDHRHTFQVIAATIAPTLGLPTPGDLITWPHTDRPLNHWRTT